MIDDDGLNFSAQSLKVALNSFQHLYFDGYILYFDPYHFDATIMVSKNCPTIGEHVVTIFVTE